MTTTLTQAPVIDAGTWQLDPVHSRVGFAVSYLAGTFHGSFAPFEATLDVDGDGALVLTGTARVDGVQVADENLGAHLQSPEFFDAERAPEIVFTSEPFRAARGEVAVDGRLSIKGVEKPVALNGIVGGPVVDPYGRSRLNIRLETTVDRSNFGLDWNIALPSGEPALGQDVELTAELALIKE
jgi:polyisoprenoid-binding protein YceI